MPVSCRNSRLRLRSHHADARRPAFQRGRVSGLGEQGFGQPAQAGIRRPRQVQFFQRGLHQLVEQHGNGTPVRSLLVVQLGHFRRARDQGLQQRRNGDAAAHGGQARHRIGLDEQAVAEHLAGAAGFVR
ncbi:hypothetical protein [Cupriavidus sp. USMAA2-4]|uniref:hypothetical protein n=1 Tax=Cupriavidus sp. USMAA2-4 TaxID=876364 RepID=UPI0018DC45C7|nr:hypothetical protein [Cupriavidus sp. USMAA2-4]